MVKKSSRDVLKRANEFIVQKIFEAISYKFKTDEIYYPLEITKPDHGVSEISLLVLTDQNLINYNGIEKR